jgi:hypothetical protein
MPLSVDRVLTILVAVLRLFRSCGVYFGFTANYTPTIVTLRRRIKIHIVLRGLFTKNSPGRPNSQFRILLWCYAKTSSRNLTKKNWLLHHDNTSYFISDFFYQKQHGCRPPPTLLFSVSPIEDKTERLPFWHNWGNRCRIVAEYLSQNTTSMMHLKNDRKAGNGTHTRKGTNSRVMVVTRPEVSF